LGAGQQVRGRPKPPGEGDPLWDMALFVSLAVAPPISFPVFPCQVAVNSMESYCLQIMTFCVTICK